MPEQEPAPTSSVCVIRVQGGGGPWEIPTKGQFSPSLSPPPPPPPKKKKKLYNCVLHVIVKMKWCFIILFRILKYNFNPKWLQNQAQKMPAFHHLQYRKFLVACKESLETRLPQTPLFFLFFPPTLGDRPNGMTPCCSSFFPLLPTNRKNMDQQMI